MATKSRTRPRARQRRRRGDSSNFNLIIGSCVLGLVVIVIAQYISPESQHYRQQQNAARREQTAADRIAVEIAAKARIEAAQAELEDQRAARNAEIAHTRYKAACTMLTARDADPQGYEYQAIALAEGVDYLDAHSGGRLVSGQVICDDRGMTGVYHDGEIIEIARAVEPGLWNKRFDDALGWHELARRSKVGE